VAANQSGKVEPLPQRDAGANCVFAVVTCVVPASGHVEVTRGQPVWVKPCSLGPGPACYRSVATVWRSAEMPGGSAVAWRPRVLDRAAGPQQIEQPQCIPSQVVVQSSSDAEWMADLVTDDDPALVRLLADR